MSTCKKPNILFIMSDDHASHAMSCYESRINQTPNLDRIADGGMRFDNCFCTNSICAPSRATILTGEYNHVNGVMTLDDHLDNRRTTFPKLLQQNGYQTAIVGKWHLGQGPAHEPTGFDYWCVLPGQGLYHDPEFIEMGQRRTIPGYVTDLIADKSLQWLKNRDPERPFMLLCHHKAPHRSWEPDEKHAHLYEDQEIPEPDTLFDDYATRARPAREAKMQVGRDLNEKDVKAVPPEDLKGNDRTRWYYQRYIKDYLRVVASIDDNVGRLLDYLEKEGLAKDTIVVYTSDQGFFLGDHGWYDKRFMYEESLRMPFIVRYPRAIQPGSICEAMALNVDFAQTFLDYAGVQAPGTMQGQSLRPLFEGAVPNGWRTAMYYRYWMHLAHHNVCSHYGIRTLRHKLIYYYGEALGTTGSVDKSWEPEWELFDLEKDPMELNNVYGDPASAEAVEDLKTQMYQLQSDVGDSR